ncbi:arginine transporter [Frigidibacter sp. MR17.24]|uniref:arginine transporter n=1 Tax=Frigidibacter sp. MR17.24 TaxID=3127345 RepID=UPI003012C2E7
MTRRLIPLAFLGLLGACAGGTEGPVNSACLAAGRSSASTQRCGCAQRAANQSLGFLDQRRAAGFFAEPDRAERVRMSDSAGDKAFWTRYEGFIERAKASCPG